jgi:hypothetical protein
MRIAPLSLMLLPFLAVSPARADLHITRDHGGYVEEYKAKYQRIRDRHERVIIDGICNSACTLVFGIVPMNKICVTPRASLGFHQAYYDKAFTFGIKVTSAEGTSDLMSYYPQPVKDWIRRNGGRSLSGRFLIQLVTHRSRRLRRHPRRRVTQYSKTLAIDVRLGRTGSSAFAAYDQRIASLNRTSRLARIGIAAQHTIRH